MENVWIINEDGSILKKPFSFIKGKTASNILEELPHIGKNSYLLGIKTPTYIKILTPSSIPNEKYPNLIVNQEDSETIPDYALQILNITELGKLFFVLKPVSINSPDITFPPYIFGFNPSNYANAMVSNFISDLTEHFGLQISNTSIYLDKKEISPKESFVSFYHKFSNYIKNCLKNAKKMEPFEFVFEIGEKGIRKIQKREYNLNEIFTSEKAYVSTLIELRDYFSPSFSAYKILNEIDHKMYFGPIPQMTQTSSDFLFELRKYKKYSCCISSVFSRFVSELKKSSKDFFMNYHLKISGHVGMIDKNHQVEKLCNDAIVNPGKSFSSIIIQPIQRIPRYPLLLRELLSSTPESHPDFIPLQLAKSQVDMMVNELDNEFMVQGVKEIEERLADTSGERSIISPNRVLKANFCVLLKERSKMSGNLYLFNDLLLLTTSMKKEIELMRITYDKFFFIPSFPNETSIIYYLDNEYRCIDFTSPDQFQRFRTVLTKNRKEILDTNSRIDPPLIIATEFYPPGYQIVPQMIDCSCSKSGNIVSVLYGRGLITFKTDEQSFEVNENIKKVKQQSKIVCVNDRTFVYGGPKCYSPIELFDDMAKNEPQKANLELMEKINAKKINGMKEGRIFHTCCSYKDYIVVFGGLNPKTMRIVSSNVYFYSIENCEWYVKKSNNKMEAMYKHSAVVYKDRMIVHGGINSNNYLLKNTWSFSFETGEWTKMKVVSKDVVTPRFGHSAVVVDHFMFVLGGTTSKTKLPRLYFRDIQKIKEDEENILNKDDFVMVINNDSFDELDKQTTSSNETENENDNDNPVLDDFSSQIDFYMSSVGLLCADCFPAPNCFCVDIENGKVEAVEIVGNFLSGLSLFAAAYDESRGKIILFGGTDSQNISQKGNPIITFLEIPEKYKNGGEEQCVDANAEETSGVQTCNANHSLNQTASALPMPLNTNII